MDSAKKPLWLVWKNEDKFVEDHAKIYIMYKSGDGLYIISMYMTWCINIRINI